MVFQNMPPKKAVRLIIAIMQSGITNQVHCLSHLAFFGRGRLFVRVLTHNILWPRTLKTALFGQSNKSKKRLLVGSSIA